MSKTVTVKAGDSLSRIAARYPGISWQELYEANKDIIGDNPDMIHAGQEFVIPEREKTVSKPAQTAKEQPPKKEEVPIATVKQEQIELFQVCQFS